MCVKDLSGVMRENHLHCFPYADIMAFATVFQKMGAAVEPWRIPYSILSGLDSYMPLVPYAVVMWCFMPEYSSPRNSVACGGYPNHRRRVSRIPGITLSKHPLASLSNIIPGVFFWVRMSMVNTLFSIGVMLVWCDLQY